MLMWLIVGLGEGLETYAQLLKQQLEGLEGENADVKKENAQLLSLLKTVQETLMNGHGLDLRTIIELINQEIVKVNPEWLIVRNPYLHRVNLSRVQADSFCDDSARSSDTETIWVAYRSASDISDNVKRVQKQMRICK